MERIDADAGVDFQPMTLAELMARDVTVEYLIDNLIAARQPILLAGPVKSLKTSILLDLCFALATGGLLSRLLPGVAVDCRCRVDRRDRACPPSRIHLARIGRAASDRPGRS